MFLLVTFVDEVFDDATDVSCRSLSWDSCMIHHKFSQFLKLSDWQWLRQEISDHVICWQMIYCYVACGSIS